MESRQQLPPTSSKSHHHCCCIFVHLRAILNADDLDKSLPREYETPIFKKGDSYFKKVIRVVCGMAGIACCNVAGPVSPSLLLVLLGMTAVAALETLSLFTQCPHFAGRPTLSECAT